MLFQSRAKSIDVIFTFLLISVLAIGCTPTPDDDQPPEAPSSMAIDDSEEDAEETESEASEPVDSFIKTTELVQATDGSAVVQIETHENLVDGTYQARYHDPEGGELSAPCLRIEGSENELQCSIALAGGLQLVEFQLFYQEPFEPFFSAGIDFTGTALGSLLDNVDAYILPPEFQAEDPLEDFDFFNYLIQLCDKWKIASQVPDSLDPICKGLIESEPLVPVGGPSGSGTSWFINECFTCSTPPDPDCDGKDAGSFWCQETEDQQYLAGRLAYTCLDQINTAFEDPLTALEVPLSAFEDPLTASEGPLLDFEDPLTAFEDPLTAFEDPLTAFEDPLTAFEDPLTAVDVARTTLLYRIAHPFIPNSEPLTACNHLAFLGDHSQFLRTGETLLEHMAGYYPAFEPVSVRLPLDTSDLAVMPAHCGHFNEMNFESWVRPEFRVHAGFMGFDALEPLPGIHYFVYGDPTPYHYSATLGDLEIDCGMAGSTGLRCSWVDLPESLYGQEHEYALYVTGCEDPLHTGVVTLPAYDYSRCTVFEEMEMSLSVADPSNNLSIAVGMPDGVPGLEVEDYPGFDNFDVYYFSRFCGEQTYCEVYDWLPGSLYCNMDVDVDCLINFNEFVLAVDQCGPILTRTLQIIAPTHGGGVGDEPGGGGGGSLCTGTELNTWVCVAHGGSWSGSSATNGTCTCP